MFPSNFKVTQKHSTNYNFSHLSSTSICFLINDLVKKISKTFQKYPLPNLVFTTSSFFVHFSITSIFQYMLPIKFTFTHAPSCGAKWYYIKVKLSLGLRWYLFNTTHRCFENKVIAVCLNIHRYL